MSIVASTVVNFGAGANSTDLVVLEFDELLNVDAAGEQKTQFAPGDSIYFRIHHAPTLRVGAMAATSGQVVVQGKVSRERSEQLLWETVSDSHELACIPAGGLDATWHGNSGSGLRKAVPRSALITGGVMPAVATVTYRAEFSLYKLLTPSVQLAEGESWPITIVAYMEAA